MVELALRQLQPQVGHHLAQLVHLELAAAVGVEGVERSLDAAGLIDALPGLLTAMDRLDLERRGVELGLFLLELRPGLLAAVHRLDLHRRRLHLPPLLKLLARLFAPVHRLNLERGAFHLLALDDVAQRARHEALHRRVQLARVRLPRALVGENLLIKLAELAEVERAGVVRVVILHQRELVVRECFRIDVDPDLLEHVVELGNLQAAASVRIELLERGLHPQQFLVLPARLLAALHRLYLDRRGLLGHIHGIRDVGSAVHFRHRGWLERSLARSGLGLSCYPWMSKFFPGSCVSNSSPKNRSLLVSKPESRKNRLGLASPGLVELLITPECKQSHAPVVSSRHNVRRVFGGSTRRLPRRRRQRVTREAPLKPRIDTLAARTAPGARARRGLRNSAPRALP